MKTSTTLFGGVVTLAVVIGTGMPANAVSARPLGIDQPTTIDNVGLDCTHVGSDDAHPHAWRNYSVKLETVGGYGQYLADESVSVRDKHGKGLFKVRCDAPWLMMKLDPGRYVASVDVQGAGVRDIAFTAPKIGQSRIMARFRDTMSGQESSLGEHSKRSMTDGTDKANRNAS